ncbi:MAG: hypothetical protein HYW27_01990 [Candidatus Aenigmarchaeota archaeon]|nr:hypothetical protein [Candidatus Aenigmarchaeota archaeon]
MRTRMFYVDTTNHVGLALEVRSAVVECTGLPDIKVYTVSQKKDGVQEYLIKYERERSIERDPMYAYVGYSGRRAEVIVCDTLGEHYERTVDLVAGICGKREESETPPPS